MKYVIKQIDGVTRVNPAIVRLDASNSAEFEALLTQLHVEGATNIDLDVSRLESIDSDGLRATVSAFAKINQHGNMTISGAHGLVARAFKMTQLHRLIEVSMLPA